MRMSSHAFALEFARSAVTHACTGCDWDPALAASAQSTPPPVVRGREVIDTTTVV
jgi:hypothetical protein